MLLTPEQSAKKLISQYGKANALKLVRMWRDNNSLGTSTYVYHNQIVQAILHIIGQ